MKKKRVLLLSEGFGTGHTQAAHAIEKGLKILYPHVNARVIELGKILNPTVAPFILGAYRRTITMSPKLIGLIYRTNYNRSLTGFRRLALHRLFYNHAKKVLTQLNPDVIICTHPFPNAVISRLKRLGLDIPLYTLITDYDAHGTWISPEVNQYLVSSPKVERMLLERNVDSQRIRITGIPVHPDFWNKQPKDAVREELGLRNIPTVMIMGGGWGLPLQDQLMENIASWKGKIQLVFCVGNNEKLAERLRESTMFQHPDIHIIGYTRKVSKLMDASDLLVTKPGGMTCTEGLAKGLPMLFAPPLPGQEEENCDYFVKSGYGTVLQNSYVLHQQFSRLHHLYANGIAASGADARLNEYEPEACTRTVHELLMQSSTRRTPVMQYASR
ncbi:glycosyltransferase [Paenibacillus shunpengii]|uniref:Glycosyltransferase n=1 Tax=Paenibacillus shunpengii TaxID=2054424 RepID=A0ABW5SL44_9BACL|nr:glycosyltransferase [Paenibacillus sp. FSL H7-0326]OMC71947.1 UDP-N-acetylglucosamine--LPS N-acetylglucosamine transferase [Paenibacillus sp. FSL H7-0326]